MNKLSINTKVFSFKLLQIMFIFSLTTVAWIFFRAESTSIAISYLRQMCTLPDISTLFNGSVYQLGLGVYDINALGFCLLILFLVDLVKYKKGLRIDEWLCTQNLWFRWMVLFILIICVIIFGEYGLNYNSSEFIYFQF